METSSNDRSGLINLVIGISLLVFILLLALWVLKIVVSVAPLIGVLVAIGGGIWYLQAEDEHYKLRALQTLFAGIVITILFGVIF